MKKRTWSIAVILFIAVLLSGCKSNFFPSRQEIDQFEVTQVVGIDKCDKDPTKVEVTFLTEGVGESRIISFQSNSGWNVFDAERMIEGRSDKKLFFGYVDFFIIGEEAAKEDLTKYFDFITRNHEIRMTPLIFIAKGCSTKELLQKTSTSDKYIVEKLKNIEDDVSLLSNYDTARIIDVANMMDNRQSAAIIPALTMGDFASEKMTGKMPEQDIFIAGYGIVKDFKLTGYIDTTYSRGYNFLVNKVNSCPISVLDASDRFVGLEVISANTKAELHFNGDTLEGVTFKTHVRSNLEEQQSREKITTENALEEIALKQSEIIKEEMQQVIVISKEQGVDCINLGEMVRMKSPLKWEKIKDNWKEIYPNLKIDIAVESDIIRSYDIREPNGYDKE